MNPIRSVIAALLTGAVIIIGTIACMAPPLAAPVPPGTTTASTTAITTTSATTAEVSTAAPARPTAATSPVTAAPPVTQASPQASQTTPPVSTSSANLPPLTADPLAPLIGPVVSVYDGDTLTVVVEGQKESVRPLGIDAPELENKGLGIQGECYGPQSRDAARALLAGTIVKLTVDPEQGDAKDDYRDLHGRLLRYVQVPLDTGDITTATDTVDFGDYQIRSGNAWVYEQYPVERTPDYMTEMAQAQQDHEGLWAACE
jgi:endonuclease YncB( thermonuclease family)